jgi:predicted CXXCH cytochrome family protein
MILMATTVFMAVPAFAAVVGSPHDYIDYIYGRCGVCHVPHAAVGSQRLWRIAPLVAAGSGWDVAPVGLLCGSCHRTGGLETVTNKAGVFPHDMDLLAYAATSHGRSMGTLGGVLTGSAGPVAGKPYTNAAANIDCTSCHNVHFEGAFAAASPKRPFLRTAATSVSGFCAECHGDRLNITVGTGNVTGNHPVTIAYTNSAANGSGNIILNATPNAALTNVVAATSWSLGGKFEGSLTVAPTAADLIGCHTCHAVHSPAATTVAGDQANHLLAIDNTGAAAALCEGCHGDNSNPARVTSGATYRVGATNPGDHPIDVAIANPGPDIDRWYTDGSTTRSERHAGANDWPRGVVGAVPTNIVCTSCHSAHKAQATLKLIRTGSANTFCTACHGDASPAGHHTHSANTGAAFGLGWTSPLDCASCHGAGALGFAHNGFSFNTFATGNDSSQLCVSCHGGATSLDPVFTLPVPADHLSIAAVDGNKSSHYIGLFVNAANAINVKTASWSATVSNFSKYGGSGTDTHNAVAPTISGTSTMICESCHSVTHNVGAGAAATPTSGYMANLLLQSYADDTNGGTGTQSGLCVACHNNNRNDIDGLGSNDGLADWSTVNAAAIVPPGTHPMTGWDITRAIDAGYVAGGTATLKTDNGTRPTYADKAGAPNAAQYYGANAMDCDSCHRPHYAPTPGTFNQTKAGGAAARPVILEKQAAVNEWADLCQECHNM